MNNSKKANEERIKVGTIVDEDGVILGGIYEGDKIVTPKQQEYTQKMLYKEKILIENKCNYLFLFSSEMKNGSYKEILQNKINEILQEVA